MPEGIQRHKALGKSFLATMWSHSRKRKSSCDLIANRSPLNSRSKGSAARTWPEQGPRERKLVLIEQSASGVYPRMMICHARQRFKSRVHMSCPGARSPASSTLALSPMSHCRLQQLLPLSVVWIVAYLCRRDTLADSRGLGAPLERSSQPADCHSVIHICAIRWCERRATASRDLCAGSYLSEVPWPN